MTKERISRNDRNTVHNIKLSPMQRRILAIFLSHAGEELCPADIIKNTGLKPSTVYWALSKLKKLGLIRVSRRHGRFVLYTLVDKAKAMLALEGKTSWDLVGGTSAPDFQWKRFLDFGSAIYAGQTLDIRIDGYLGDVFRKSGKFRKPSKKDRAKHYFYYSKEFSLNLSKYNSLRIIFKTPQITPLVQFLQDLGIDRYNIMLLMDGIVRKLGDSRLEVEIPIKEKIPKFTIRTKIGDKVLTSRIVRSHFPQGELEIKGNALLVQNFINTLAGVQHFSVLDYANFSEVQKLNANFITMARGLRDIVDALERTALAQQSAAAQNQKQKQKKEALDYYG